jgi:hypothetical protein
LLIVIVVFRPRLRPENVDGNPAGKVLKQDLKKVYAR